MARRDLMNELLRFQETQLRAAPRLRSSPTTDRDFERFFLSSWHDVDLGYFDENDDALLSMTPEFYCWVIPKVLFALVGFGRAVEPVRFFSDFLTWPRMFPEFARKCQNLNYFDEKQLGQLLDICSRIAISAEIHLPEEHDIPLFQEELYDFYRFLESLGCEKKSG